MTDEKYSLPVFQFSYFQLEDEDEDGGTIQADERARVPVYELGDNGIFNVLVISIFSGVGDIIDNSQHEEPDNRNGNGEVERDEEDEEEQAVQDEEYGRTLGDDSCEI